MSVKRNEELWLRQVRARDGAGVPLFGLILLRFGILFLVLLGAIDGAQAAAKSVVSTCETLFQVRPEREASKLRRSRPSSEAQLKAWHRDALARAQARLQMAGVNYNVVSATPGLRGSREIIEISPEGASKFNILALRLREAFHGKLRFDPFKTSDEAFFSPRQNHIGISFVEALRAEPNESSAHEAVHMAVSHLAKNDAAVVFDVSVKAPGEKTEHVEETAAHAYEIQYLFGKMEEAESAGDVTRAGDLRDSLFAAAQFGKRHTANSDRLLREMIRNLRNFKTSAHARSLKELRDVVGIYFADDVPRSVKIFWIDGKTNGVIRSSNPKLVKQARELDALERTTGGGARRKLAAYQAVLSALEGQLQRVEGLTSAMKLEFQRLDEVLAADAGMTSHAQLRDITDTMIMHLRDRGGFEIDLDLIMPP